MFGKAGNISTVGQIGKRLNTFEKLEHELKQQEHVWTIWKTYESVGKFSKVDKVGKRRENIESWKTS